MTVTVEQLRDRSRLQSCWLVEITLKNSGPTLYFSDRNITIGNQRYDNYIESIEGTGEEIRRLDSTFLNTNITVKFRNLAWGTYARLNDLNDAYPFEGADITIKEALIDDSGSPLAPETCFVGNMDELKGIMRKGFQSKLNTRLYYANLIW